MKKPSRIIGLVATGLLAAMALTGCASFGVKPAPMSGLEAMAMADKSPTEVLTLVLKYSEYEAMQKGYTETSKDSAYPKQEGLWSYNPATGKCIGAWVGSKKATEYGICTGGSASQILSMITNPEGPLTVAREGDAFTLNYSLNGEWKYVIEASDGLFRGDTVTGTDGRIVKSNFLYLVTDEAQRLGAVSTPIPTLQGTPELVG